MKKFIWLTVVVLIFANSCKHPDRTKEEFLEKQKKGTVIPKIVCKDAPQQNYCLYLPTSYSTDKNFPVIYAFDSHGDGRVPVELMKDEAEKLGYILVGSNNSQNGLSSAEINHIVNLLISDTRKKLAIDNHRVYTAGFSGGARVACGVAQSVKGISGVIACSAGFRPGTSPPAFHFIGIAGTQDMNYLEMKQLDEVLDHLKASAQFLVFHGKHQWPPESVLADAMTTLELYAMQDSIIPVNRNLADLVKKGYVNRIDAMMSKGDPDNLAGAYALLNRAIEMLNGLTDISKLTAIQEGLKPMPELRDYMIEQAALENYEFQKQQEFVSSFDSQPEKWWNSEIGKLNKDAGTGSDSLQINTAQRLLGYISLNCYSYVNRSLQTKNWQALELFTGIYKQADPKNYYCWYALACLDANKGNKAEAFADLQKSVEYGYPNVESLQNDPLLASLHGMPGFEALAKK